MRRIYADDLKKGDRVVFRDYQLTYQSTSPISPSLQQWIDTHDYEQRKAVFIGTREISFDKKWLCFLLDSPLTAANVLEDQIHLANHFAVDEKFLQSFVVIDSSLLTISILIERCATLEDLSLVTCCINDCLKVGYAKDFIRFCNASHCVCWAHGSPETLEYKAAENALLREVAEGTIINDEWEARLFYYTIARTNHKSPDTFYLCRQSNQDCITGLYNCICLVKFQDLERELLNKTHLKQQRSIKRASPTTPDVNQLALDHTSTQHDNNTSSNGDQNLAKKARLDSSPTATNTKQTSVTDYLVSTPIKSTRRVYDVENVLKTKFDDLLQSIKGYSDLPDYTREKMSRLIHTAESNKAFTSGTIKAVLRELDSSKILTLDEDEFNYLLTVKLSERESTQPQDPLDETPTPDEARNVVKIEDNIIKTRFYGKKLYIFIERPDDPATGIKQLLVRSDMSYDDVLHLACSLLGCSILRQDMMLVRQDANGWNYKLEYELLIRGVDNNSLWDKVYTGNLLQLRKITSAFLGGRYKLSFISTLEKYNRSIAKKIDTLNEDYEGYLEIRGDGNCYYRAVIYGLLEQIIFREDRQECLQELHSIFKQIKFAEYEMVYQDNHNRLLIALDMAARNERWMTLKELESDILQESTGLDRALIIAGKRLVRDYLHDNQDSDWNGLSLKIAVMSYERYESFDEYLEQEVMKMGECAEGPHVDIGVLPMLLNAYAEIVMLDRSETVGILKKGGGADQADNADHATRKFSVSLLFRPGHYDLLYPNQMLNNLFQGSYFLPEIQPHQEIEDEQQGEGMIEETGVKMQTDDIEIWNDPLNLPVHQSKQRVLPSTITSSNSSSGSSRAVANSKLDTRIVADLITGPSEPPVAIYSTEAEAKFDQAWNACYIKNRELQLAWKKFARELHFSYGFDLETIFRSYSSRLFRTEEWLDACLQSKDTFASEPANVSHSKVSYSGSSSSGGGIGYNRNTYVPPKQQTLAEIDYTGLDPNDAATLQLAFKDAELTDYQLKEALPCIVKLRKEGFSLQHLINAIKEGFLLEDSLRGYCLTQIARSSPHNSIASDIKSRQSFSSAGPFTANMNVADIANASPFPSSFRSSHTPPVTSHQPAEHESHEWLQTQVKNKEEEIVLQSILKALPFSCHKDFMLFYQKIIKKLDCKLSDIAAAAEAGNFGETSIENFVRKNKAAATSAQAPPPVFKTYGGSHHSGAAGSSNRFSHLAYQPIHDNVADKKKIDAEEEEEVRTQPQTLSSSSQDNKSPSREFDVEVYKKGMTLDDLQQLDRGLDGVNFHHRKQAELNVLAIHSEGLYPMELILRAIRNESKLFSVSVISKYCQKNVDQYFEDREQQEAIANEKRAKLNIQQRQQQSDPVPAPISLPVPDNAEKKRADTAEDEISLDSTISCDQVQLQEISSSPMKSQQVTNANKNTSKTVCLSQEHLANQVDKSFHKSFYYSLYEVSVNVFGLPSPFVIEAILEKRCFNFRMIIREVLIRQNKLEMLPYELSDGYKANKKDDKSVADLYQTAVNDEQFDRQIVLDLIGLNNVQTMDEMKFKRQGWLRKRKLLDVAAASSSTLPPTKNIRDDFEGINKDLIYNSNNVHQASMDMSSNIKPRSKSAMSSGFGANRDTNFSSSISSSGNYNINGSNGLGTNYRLPTSANSPSSNRPRPATPSSIVRKASGTGSNFTSPQPLQSISRSPKQIVLSKDEEMQFKNLVLEANGVGRAEVMNWLNIFGYDANGKGLPQQRNQLKEVRRIYFDSIKKK